MTKLIRTSKWFKMSKENETVILHHNDWDWTVLKENKNCYLLSQDWLFTVRTKDPKGRIGFYIWDSSSMAYHIFNMIWDMDMKHNVND